jgi:signal peptidase II
MATVNTAASPEESSMTRPGNPYGRATLLPWLVLAAVVVMLDQLTKVLVVRAFALGERLAVIPGWFDLILVYNKGAAFSFLAWADGWQRWLFIGIGFAAIIFILYLLIAHGSQRLFGFALALILGGAIGNVIDRIIHGQVVDFLLVHWQDTWYFPAFNVADAALTVGAVLLILDELLRVRKSR